MSILADNWFRLYQGLGAIWVYNNDNDKDKAGRPHALLTSGNHSNGFFNSRLVIPKQILLSAAVTNLLEMFVRQGGNVSEVQCVVGPQTGATKLAEVIRNQVLNSRNEFCYYASPAKNEKEGGRSMVFSSEELDLLQYKSVLLCEDVLTTGGSVDLTSSAVIFAGGIVLPFILVLVNRSGLTEVNGRKIIALIDCPMQMWTPEECPLCKQGSEAIRPKGPPEWARLNASY